MVQAAAVKMTNYAWQTALTNGLESLRLFLQPH